VQASGFEILLEAAQLTDGQLSELKSLVAGEYQADPMMQDLRLVRILHAIVDGKVKPNEAIEEMRADAARRVAR